MMKFNSNQRNDNNSLAATLCGQDLYMRSLIEDLLKPTRSYSKERETLIKKAIAVINGEESAESAKQVLTQSIIDPRI
ncbi:MAG: hypothetical protein V4485_03650 [Pseudomonadota bacterium]